MLRPRRAPGQSGSGVHPGSGNHPSGIGGQVGGAVNRIAGYADARW